MKKTICALMTGMILLGACINDKRKEIEQRRAALEQKQVSAIEQAQQDLARTDSLLEAVKVRHDAQHAYVMEHATELKDDSPEVMELNRLRKERDSLQAQWETLGARIQYIRRCQERGGDSLR